MPVSFSMRVPNILTFLKAVLFLKIETGSSYAVTPTVCATLKRHRMSAHKAATPLRTCWIFFFFFRPLRSRLLEYVRTSDVKASPSAQ